MTFTNEDDDDASVDDGRPRRLGAKDNAKGDSTEC